MQHRMSELKAQTRWPHLSRAPIVEGLIDFRVTADQQLADSQLKQVASELRQHFPTIEERIAVERTIMLGPDGPASVSGKQQLVMLVLKSDDGRTVVQCKKDGLTCSRLAPYETWHHLESTMKRCWDVYRVSLGTNPVVRLAVRYINRIPVKVGEPLHRTFRSSFTLAPALPQEVATYLTRIVLPFPPDPVHAILTQTMDPNTRDSILDADVVWEDSAGISDADAFAHLQQLRAIKNLIFFESLTSDALEAMK